MKKPAVKQIPTPPPNSPTALLAALHDLADNLWIRYRPVERDGRSGLLELVTTKGGDASVLTFALGAEMMSAIPPPISPLQE